jgi:DNA-binding transcriptional LysR family regulator
MPSLRAFECLLAAADLGSVTRAARHLHLSQPAISHQLAALEREAGTALLTRDRRGVHLTAAGRAALPEARRAVDAAGDAIRLARAVGQGVGGIVRVVCAQSLTVALLAPVLARWNLDRPNVVISLRESTDPETARGRYDPSSLDGNDASSPRPRPRATHSPLNWSVISAVQVCGYRPTSPSSLHRPPSPPRSLDDARTAPVALR